MSNVLTARGYVLAAAALRLAKVARDVKPSVTAPQPARAVIGRRKPTAK